MSSNAPDASIAVAGGYVYWTDQRGLMREPEAGGAQVRVTSPGAVSIAVDAASVYWLAVNARWVSTYQFVTEPQVLKTVR